MDSEENQRKADQNAKKLVETNQVSLGTYLIDDFRKINGPTSTIKKDIPKTKTDDKSQALV